MKDSSYFVGLLNKQYYLYNIELTKKYGAPVHKIGMKPNLFGTLVITNNIDKTTILETFLFTSIDVYERVCKIIDHIIHNKGTCKLTNEFHITQGDGGQVTIKVDLTNFDEYFLIEILDIIGFKKRN